MHAVLLLYPTLDRRDVFHYQGVQGLHSPLINTLALSPRTIYKAEILVASLLSSHMVELLW